MVAQTQVEIQRGAIRWRVCADKCIFRVDGTDISDRHQSMIKPLLNPSLVCLKNFSVTVVLVGHERGSSSGVLPIPLRREIHAGNFFSPATLFGRKVAGIEHQTQFVSGVSNKISESNCMQGEETLLCGLSKNDTLGGQLHC